MGNLLDKVPGRFRPVGFIFLINPVPLCRDGRIKGHDDTVGLLLSYYLKEHIRKTVDRIRWNTFRGCEPFNSIIGPIYVGIAVDKIKVHRRLYPKISMKEAYGLQKREIQNHCPKNY